MCWKPFRQWNLGVQGRRKRKRKASSWSSRHKWKCFVFKAHQRKTPASVEAFPTAFPHAVRLFGQEREGWIPSSPAGSCRATASSLKKKKIKTSEDLVAPWLRRWATARSVRCQWSASTGVEPTATEKNCRSCISEPELGFDATYRLLKHCREYQGGNKLKEPAHTCSSCKEMV